jgi:ABC-type proline/glycine betaine transport system substrate-binding protein
MSEPSVEEIVAEAERWGTLPDPTDIHALIASWRDLVAENFALAANQCHDGYGDEWGNHCCRSIDKAVSECEFLAKEYEALRAQNAALVAALEEARGWVQDEVDADPRHRGADVLARIDTALAAARKDAP